MSELKEIGIRWEENGELHFSHVYLKYEADKVIAEKDAEIAELIEKNKRLANKDIIMASETIKDLYKELRHSNYKRCLAMAAICSRNMDLCICDTPEWPRGNLELWKKRKVRWLALAEEPTWAKFMQLIHKEAK